MHYHLMIFLRLTWANPTEVISKVWKGGRMDTICGNPPSSAHEQIVSSSPSLASVHTAHMASLYIMTYEPVVVSH